MHDTSHPFDLAVFTAVLAWLAHWLSSADPLALVGVVINAICVAGNLYFAWRRDRRDAARQGKNHDLG